MFQFAFVSVFLRLTLPKPAFEPFLRFPPPHTSLFYCYIVALEGGKPPLALQFTPIQEEISIGGRDVPVRARKRVPPADTAEARSRAVPQGPAQKELSKAGC